MTNVCSCPSMEHACGQACVSDTAVTSCGASCNACPPPPANGVASTCDQGTCGFTCAAGYTRQGAACVDVDECLTANGGCAAQATCTNTPGSRTCACNAGFTGDGLTCADVNECLTNNGGCSANAMCTNTPGARTCACNTGFTGDGVTCSDVNECLTNNGACSGNATCTNTPGSRTCACNSGYSGDGLTCADVNECLTNNGGCATNATCTNTPGSRTCACNSGYSGTGLTCTDVNECLTNNGGCATNATCTNTPGSRTCTCLTGYSGDGVTCADINECLTSNGGCATRGVCINTPGSRLCTCGVGYQGNGLTCGPVWTPMHLTRREGHAMVFDSTRSRFVLYGGNASFGELLGDTWESPDGVSWTLAATAGPAPRTRAAMAFDSVRGRVVLFGGQTATGALNDTWEWDGALWTQRAPTASPSPRGHAGLAFDTTRRRMVLFGGRAGAGFSPSNELWEFDGTTWTSRVTGPVARYGLSLTWNPQRQVVTLFGGRDLSTLYNDLWEWNGTSWTQRTPASPPTPRFNHSATWDSSAQRLVVVGGLLTTYQYATPIAEAWTFDGATWSPLPATTEPIHSAGLAFSTGRGSLLVLGTGSDPTPTIRALSGSTWSDVSSMPMAPTSVTPVATWDSTRNTFVVARDLYGTAYQWNGTAWVVLGSGTSGGVPEVIRYDAFRRETVVLSGSNETFTSDGGRFSLRTSVGPSPTRTNAASTYNPNSQTVMMFGGTTGAETLNDLWEWRGTSWVQLMGAAPGARRFAVMAYDTTRNNLVLFGGGNLGLTTLFTDTWLRSPSSGWTSTSATGPAGRFRAGMVWDPEIQRVVLYGGSSLTNELYDQWEWNGTSWTQVALERTAEPPAQLEYDTTNRRIVMLSQAQHLWYRPSN